MDATQTSRASAWQPAPSFWHRRPVAVTGGTGFVGSHLVAELVGLGAAVVVLQRDRLARAELVASWWDRVTVVEGELEDRDVLERMLGDYEVATLFHLAAQSQVGVANRNPVGTFEANVRGTWNVLEATRRAPTVSGVVVASSDKAYGSQASLPYVEGAPLNARHPYDVSKACADMISASYVEVFDLPVAVTRCGNFFGPSDLNWQRLVPSVIRSVLAGERPVIRSDGRSTRDYLYVVDGVRAYLQLAEALTADRALAGEAFNFSLERPLSVLDMVALVQEAAGTSLEPDVRATATNEIDHQWLSAAKARDRLGWAPSRSMEQAVAETVGWYRDHAGDG